MLGFSIDLVLLTISFLFLISIAVSKAGGRFGVPVLLLFLGVGMLFGKDGLFLHIRFDNFELAQAVSTFALSVILFSGGLDTKLDDIKPVWKEGVALSTIGVFLTTLITGLMIFLVAKAFLRDSNFDLLRSFLLAAVMSSTDSASVFAILRSKGIALKNNLRPMLELESGSNDPMAFLLTITLIQVINSLNAGAASVILNFILQVVIGAFLGLFLGYLSVKLMQKINLSNDALYPVLLLTCCIFIYSFTQVARGNGYLAVYISGLILGRERFRTKRSTRNFFDNFAWMAQIILFLSLGLLVSPKELGHVAVPAIIISIFLIAPGRLAAVFISLFPFKIPRNDKFFLSFVGLRGAVPIVFAILPLVNGIDVAKEIFNVVFFITIISLLLQGTFFSSIAKWLGLSEEKFERRKLTEFDIEVDEDIKSAMTEIALTEDIIERKGKNLMGMNLPDGTLAVMVKRDNNYFIPKGYTDLKSGDKLLIITDNQDALRETYKAMGLDDFIVKSKS